MKNFASLGRLICRERERNLGARWLRLFKRGRPCYGSFVRSFGLPEGVDPEKIEANFAKGVLTVKLPKTQEAQKSAKKIEVKAA
jgi:HSP20 family molecular chaperone IbpA